MLRRTILAAILLVAGAADAWAIDYIVPEASLRFPKWLGRFMMQDGTQAPRSELGHILRYTRGAFVGSIYIYDGGRRPIPDGVRNAVVQAEFERAQRDVLAVARLTNQPAPVKRSDAVHRDTGIEFLSATYEAGHASVRHDTVVAITGARGQYIKLRMSGAPGDDDSNVKTFRSHVATLLAGGTVPPDPPPAPATPAFRAAALTLPAVLAGYQRVEDDEPPSLLASDNVELHYRKGDFSRARISLDRPSQPPSADGIQSPELRARLAAEHLEMIQGAGQAIAAGLPYTTVAPRSPDPVSFGAYGGPTWPFMRATVAMRGGGVLETEVAIHLTMWRGYFLQVSGMNYAQDADELRLFMSALVRALPR